MTRIAGMPRPETKTKHHFNKKEDSEGGGRGGWYNSKGDGVGMGATPRVDVLGGAPSSQ